MSQPGDNSAASHRHTPADGRAFRTALGRFATGICVITARDRKGELFGVTVNSFSSVSLDPALILWSVQRSSECYADFLVADCFAVNILGDAQREASQRYARRNQHVLDADDYHLTRDGFALLNQSIASFECRLWARHEAGDHDILIGEVLHFSLAQHHAPLLFYGGGYRDLAEKAE